MTVNSFPLYSEFCSNFFHSHFVVGNLEKICTVVFRILNCVKNQGLTKPAVTLKGRGEKGRGTEETTISRKSYTANLSNKDTVEYSDFEAVGVGVTARL